MKLTNISQTTGVYLRDLKVVISSQVEGRRGEDRYLGPGDSAYLPNTSQVLRSVISGDIRQFVSKGILKLEDEVTLDPSGGAEDSVTLAHDFHFPPTVYVLKKVGATWVDGTGTVDIVHNETFTEVEVSNATAFTLTLLIRLL